MPVIDIKATGDNIVKFRNKLGITVKDIQNTFGFSTPQAIYKWQNGACMPTIDNLVILAAIFHCKVDDILVVQMMN